MSDRMHDANEIKEAFMQQLGGLGYGICGGLAASKAFDREVAMMQVIVTNILRRGDGKETPIRIIRQVWTMDGQLIAELDPLSE
jgi:hypothetical protein